MSDIELLDEEEELEVDLENEVSEIYIYEYQKLTNKPSINGVELIGNKTFEDLGLSPLSNEEIENILV